MTDKEVFRNIMEKYMYEMTQYYPQMMKDDGDYHYDWLDSYFSGDDSRKAFYIMNDDVVVGFALINRYSCLGNDIDHALAEFTIFPMYRNKGYGLEAVKQIFDYYPGNWEIKYSKRNEKAMNLWIKATEPYETVVIDLDEDEQVRSFSVGE